jgi:hypothetical protein
MAKHIYITNTEGGYFYRIYPKLPRYRIDEENKVQRELFNPPPDVSQSVTVTSLYGKFVDKYHDKDLMVELLAQASICITCLLTGVQQERKLQSRIIIAVPENIYRFPFIKNRIYSISITSVNEILLP